MNQFWLGLGLLIFLAVPPVANLMESVMIIHMHMQMPMLIIAGFLMGKFFLEKFPRFFEKYNENGIPGILLFIIILSYWMLPRTMDEALTEVPVEIFKFISLPFLAGVSLRISWQKLSTFMKNGVFILYTILFLIMGWLYVQSDSQLCNNYLVIDQIILGWGFIAMAVCIVIYLAYTFFIDPSEYE